MYTGKVVLVTGASRGVGLDIARYFLKMGATVIGFSTAAGKVDDECYHHFSINIGEPASVIDCFKKNISKKFPAIHIVINNAAILTSQYAMILPAKNAIDMVNVNLLGLFFVTREAVKLMRNSDSGRIINISSMAVNLLPAGDSIYAATKAGANTLINIMAKEFSSYNVTCNTIAITAYDTDMLRSHSETAQVKIKEIISNLTIPRVAQFEDISNVIDFYCSEKSSYITSQVINLGGII